MVMGQAEADALIARLVNEAPPLTVEQRVKLALLLSKAIPSSVVPDEPAPRTPGEVLTVEEVSKLMGVGRTSVYELIRTGALESFQIGRLRRVRHRDLRKYLDGLT